MLSAQFLPLNQAQLELDQLILATLNGGGGIGGNARLGQKYPPLRKLKRSVNKQAGSESSQEENEKESKVSAFIYGVDQSKTFGG